MKIRNWHIILPLILLGVFLIAPMVYAQDGSGTAMGKILGTVIGFIAASAIKVLGVFFGLLVQGIMWVGSFQNIINAPPVVFGWVIVRDIANMFFIVVLLFIAVGTLLGHEEYEWHKILPRFVGSIILINFSKTIAGFFIDFSQVITLTFMNAIANAGEGNFANLFGVEKFWSLNPSSSVFQGSDPFFVGAAMVFAAILLFIAVIVLAVILVIFIFRLIILWFLVVLFPIAILAGAWPGESAHKYYKEWWENFSNYLIVGPVLSFFVWLALMSASYTRAIVSNSGPAIPPSDMVTGITQIQSTDAFVGYVVGVGMLVIGLEITSKLGVVGSKLAGSALSWLEHAGTGLLKGALAAPLKGTAWTGAWAARKVKAYGVPGTNQWLRGWEFNPVNIWHQLQHGFEAKKKKEESLGSQYAAEVVSEGGITGLVGGLGSSAWVENYAEDYLWMSGIKKVLLATRGRTKLRELRAQEDAARQGAIVPEQAAKTIEDIVKNEISTANPGFAPNVVQRAATDYLAVSVDARAVDYRNSQAMVVAARTRAEDFKTRADNYAKNVPVDYEGQAEMWKLISEKQKEVAGMASDQFGEALKGALAREDSHQVMAIMQEAMKKGDLNNAMEGVGYDFSHEGISRFVNEKLIKQLRLSQQSAFAFQRMISNQALAARHSAAMEGVGVRDGQFFQRTAAEQARIATIQVNKIDPERFVRDVTRLGYCDEIMDPATGGHTSVVNQVGIQRVATLWKAMEQQMKAKRMNPEAARVLSNRENLQRLRAALKGPGKRFASTAEQSEFEAFLSKLEDWGQRGIPPP